MKNFYKRKKIFMEEEIKELTLLLLYLTSWKEKDVFGDEITL